MTLPPFLQLSATAREKERERQNALRKQMFAEKQTPDLEGDALADYYAGEGKFAEAAEAAVDEDKKLWYGVAAESQQRERRGQ